MYVCVFFVVGFVVCVSLQYITSHMTMIRSCVHCSIHMFCVRVTQESHDVSHDFIAALLHGIFFSFLHCEMSC